MKLMLLAKSMSIKNDRYILDYVFDGNILTNDAYKGIFVLDMFLKPIRHYDIQEKLLVTHYYLSDDRVHFLSYSEDGYLCYINLQDSFFVPVKKFINGDIILNPEYIWDGGRFIIADYKANYYCYDVSTNEFFDLNNNIKDQQLQIFQTLRNYKSAYRLLYYDFKNKIFVYRTNVYKDSEVFWKNLDQKIDICFMPSIEDIYRAGCIDELLYLINDDFVVFYHLDKEVYRLKTKEKYRSFGAHLYEHDKNIYFVMLSSHIQDPEDTIIDLYKIEK